MRDLDLDRYSFRTVEADLQHFFPIFDKKRVLALRGRIVTTAADGRADRSVLFPSDARRQRLAAERARFPIPRHERAGGERRISMGSVFRSGHGAVRRSGQGRAARRRSRFRRSGTAPTASGFRFNTYKAVFLRLDVALAGGETPRLSSSSARRSDACAHAPDRSSHSRSFVADRFADPRAPVRSSSATIPSRAIRKRRMLRACSRSRSASSSISSRTRSSMPGTERLSRAVNVNTIDEVPDSSWFTNRAGTARWRRQTQPRDRTRGTGPAPGPWTIVAAKAEGITPG